MDCPWATAPKASATSLPPLQLRLLPGWANQLPDGFSSRCGPARRMESCGSKEKPHFADGVVVVYVKTGGGYLHASSQYKEGMGRLPRLGPQHVEGSRSHEVLHHPIMGSAEEVDRKSVV